ncbi:MAG: dicarboxylate/amino acid:cation symporter [Chlamydiales bacterium]|nr:dicarboxylate/amino acid:cation symporter [Chlamydiales bacterium]
MFLPYTIAIGLGLLTGLFPQPLLFSLATYVSDVFMNLLKLVSTPILFLSIVTVASGMENMNAMALMGKKVIKYTIITTILAASLALAIFLIIDPVGAATVLKSSTTAPVAATQGNYWKHLLDIVPSNIVQPFATNNIISVLIIAFIMSLGMFAIAPAQRQVLHGVFSAFYSLFMKITGVIVRFVPIALWAFIALFVRDLQQGLDITTIGLYLACVILANVIQGVVILPAILKAKGIAPITLAKAMFPALTVAFFTKSSSATVPSAVRAAQDRANIDSKVAGFAFPLCTSINMNGCAAFILITVLFVSMLNGITFSAFELVLWVFMATLAAIGNASVPMGCFFLSGAFLAAMNVPLSIMGVILPFYAFIDALETSLNVWSDSCVAAIVDKELKSTPIPVFAKN